MRVFIANRGEIALRLVRACHELGWQAVAGYAKADRDLLHLRYADDIICIGERSYLEKSNLIVAAKNTGCDAVHPGYGFLSEDAEFAAMVEEQGLVFVGPSAETIAIMGDKALARQQADDFGIATIPGSASLLDAGMLADAARVIGFPLLMKASYGGGGRGISLVDSEQDLESSFALAHAEAKAGFGRGEIYLEKYLGKARHIEVQIAGDGSGEAVHFGTRECSIQRKQQKVLEEAPATGIDSERLNALCDQAAAFAASLEYRGLGTLEFLYQDDQFYFIEMNTRIQVEHPVTEAIYGIDLARMQLKLCSGQQGLEPVEEPSGHAIECRINAEDENFNPSPGKVHRLTLPGGPGIRVDTHVFDGYQIPHEYDSLMAKVIAWDTDRQSAIPRMERALAEFTLQGIETNIPLHRKILSSEVFRAGDVTTNFIQEQL